uniref:Uncharacterized protein n=1 Tax=Rhizophora mucronata TaxID=61149 RepID=A0A2P2PIE7_RHIMU
MIMLAPLIIIADLSKIILRYIIES